MLTGKLVIIEGPKTKKVLKTEGKAWACSPTSWEDFLSLASLEDRGLASLQEPTEPLLWGWPRRPGQLGVQPQDRDEPSISTIQTCNG